VTTTMDKAPPRAVFLDRDGVLVVPIFRDGRSYAPTSLEQFHLYPDAAASLERLRHAGFHVVVVTNQPDVGAGRMLRSTVEKMHARMREALSIDVVKVCYHTREDACACRKPLPGMLLEAAAELHIDRGRSYMIGDRASDISAGSAAGCRTIFVERGYIAEPSPAGADWVVHSLGEATTSILAS
jgi:D-glycero-D-manno-heptose 1,7-bisphosphate phosphatase